jgi:hypothetical protein
MSNIISDWWDTVVFIRLLPTFAGLMQGDGAGCSEFACGLQYRQARVAPCVTARVLQRKYSQAPPW